MLGLDGLRGLAALYVVLFHCWLYTFPGYPDSSAPPWLDGLMFGRLAVVFFLVLSGFSLAISPARHGWRSGGVAQFLRRRAWRILPPYWAALVISLIISWFVVPASHFGPPTGASILVYGFLTQDMFTAPTPNGAFYSRCPSSGNRSWKSMIVLGRSHWTGRSARDRERLSGSAVAVSCEDAAPQHPRPDAP